MYRNCTARSSGLLLANLLASRVSEMTKPAGQGSDLRVCGGQGRGRTADLPIFSRTLVPTELPGLRRPHPPRGAGKAATPTGLEPATSAVTGRRANQLRYGASITRERACNDRRRRTGAPNGIRTRAAALKGRCPGPLDD